jgi:uncharacterized membrane-anchored protein
MRVRAFARPEPLAAKVPEITLAFWIVKVLTTGMGESISDYLGELSIVLAVGVGVLGLALALGLQLRTREYRAPVYWFTVLMVAVFGTMLADGVRDALHVPYAVTTALYGLGALCAFLVWYRREGTLSIHSITTRSRELFYWLAVLVTFALGTAAGDFTASSLRIGYLGSIAWWRFDLNPIVAFWSAYIVTRPLGASFADWLSKPRTLHSLRGGLALGDGTVSAVALVLFVGLVTYVAVARRDIQQHPTEAAHGRRKRTPLEPSVEGAGS